MDHPMTTNEILDLWTPRRNKPSARQIAALMAIDKRVASRQIGVLVGKGTEYYNGWWLK